MAALGTERYSCPAPGCDYDLCGVCVGVRMGRIRQGPSGGVELCDVLLACRGPYFFVDARTVARVFEALSVKEEDEDDDDDKEDDDDSNNQAEEEPGASKESEGSDGAPAVEDPPEDCVIEIEDSDPEEETLPELEVRAKKRKLLVEDARSAADALAILHSIHLGPNVEERESVARLARHALSA